MPRSQHDVDVCLLADGIRPNTIGGVSRWAAHLATGLPELTFAMAGSLGELPRARIYHALTPAAAANAGPQVHGAGRPLVLTCHAMSDAWRPEGAPRIGPDSSHGGGGGHGDDNEGDHGDDGHESDYGDDRFEHERNGYAAADAIGAVSHAVAASHIAAGAPGDRTVVIPNGVSVDAGERAVTAPLVGFVGRIAPVKGLPRLLAAMRAVRAARPDARLALVGPSEAPRDHLRQLRDLAYEPGLRGAVTFVGADRPERWYPRLACLALASESEGMPLVLLEAMAHGVPCVAPDVGGIRDTLGDAGLIVAARDDDALAEGILRVLDDEAVAARLASAGRARAARWTAADSAAAYAALYEQLGLACRTSCC